MIHNPPSTEIHLFLHLSPAIVAMDGPAASGKSTIGHLLAEMTDFLFFDTGIMYRAVTWAALNQRVDLHDQAAVGAVAQQTQIDLSPPSADESDGRQNSVLVDHEDVTWKIRTQSVDQNVSIVAANPLVRRALSDQQRRIALHYGSGKAEKPGVIMIGRDMGTVVVPEAPLKLYLEASPEKRAQRRHHEMAERGKYVDYDEVLADIIARDKIDSERALAPLRPADDAIVIDTSPLSTREVIEEIVKVAKLQGGKVAS